MGYQLTEDSSQIFSKTVKVYFGGEKAYFGDIAFTFEDSWKCWNLDILYASELLAKPSADGRSFFRMLPHLSKLMDKSAATLMSRLSKKCISAASAAPASAMESETALHQIVMLGSCDVALAVAVEVVLG